MAVRVVLAVALTVALVGASTPALDRARVDAADGRIGSELDALRDAAAALRASSDPVPPGEAGARRDIVLWLPGETWGRSAVERLSLGNGTVTWRVAGGTTHTRRLPGLRGRAGDGGPLVLRGGGERRLRLRLVRAGGRETVTVRRRFKSENGASRRHVPLRRV